MIGLKVRSIKLEAGEEAEIESGLNSSIGIVLDECNLVACLDFISLFLFSSTTYFNGTGRLPLLERDRFIREMMLLFFFDSMPSSFRIDE